VGLPANHAPRKSKMSCTVMPPVLLKSARQQGTVEYGGTCGPVVLALHWPWALTKCVFAPVQSVCEATIAQVAPRQHAPVRIGQGGSWQTVPLPR